MEWYYELNGKQQGPVSAENLLAIQKSGVISEGSLVWNETLSNWEPLANHAASLRETVGDSVELAGDLAVCAYSGKVMSKSEMVPYGDQWIAPEHKESFVQGMIQGETPTAAATSGMNFGGFWVRFVAKFIDGLLMMGLTVLIVLPFGLASSMNPLDADEYATYDSPLLFFRTSCTWC